MNTKQTAILNALDPATFGADIAKRLNEHIFTLMLETDAAACCPRFLGLQGDVRNLVGYAQGGFWSDEGCAIDAANGVVHACFGPWAEHHFDPDLTDDELDPLRIVLCAAIERDTAENEQARRPA